MHRIERYRALCADGRTHDEQKTLNHQGRWKPTTIVRLEWECNGRPIEISHVYGLMAQLLPDRSGVDGRMRSHFDNHTRHRQALEELFNFLPPRPKLALAKRLPA